MFGLFLSDSKKLEKQSMVSVVADLRDVSLSTISFIVETLLLLEVLLWWSGVCGYIVRPFQDDGLLFLDYAEMLLDMLLLPSRLLLNCDEYELYYLLFCEQSINPKVLWRIWVPNNNEILFRCQLSNLWKDKNVETQNEGFHLVIHFLHFMCCWENVAWI